MKPLSEWTDRELREAICFTPSWMGWTMDEMINELLRRERKRCADEVARMVGRWDESGGADDALSMAASRIRGLS